VKKSIEQCYCRYDPENPEWRKFQKVKVGTKEHGTLRRRQVRQRADEARRALAMLHSLNEGNLHSTIKNNFNLLMFKVRIYFTVELILGPMRCLLGISFVGRYIDRLG